MGYLFRPHMHDYVDDHGHLSRQNEHCSGQVYKLIGYISTFW